MIKAIPPPIRSVQIVFSLACAVFLSDAFGQAYRDSIRAWQLEMNAQFADSAASPLTEADRQQFEGLAFYEIDSAFSDSARLELSPRSEPFVMATTTGRKAHYRQYALAHFQIKGDSLVLPVYENLRLKGQPGYEDYLFLPFTDATNGAETYGGGRYLNLRKPPEGQLLLIDFNKAYNPYCAYNERYSCPIPPAENRVEIAIEAGVKAPRKENDH